MTALPPLPAVQLALRQATELLAGELAQPGTASPNWSDFEWSMARAAAVVQGITPLLADVLRWRGPPEWEEFVSQQRLHTLLRQRRIAALMAGIDEQARRAGIAIVPLKGMALHRLGLYSAGQRPMADIDLLVQQRDELRTTQLLEAMDYRETFLTWKNRILEPPATAIAVPAIGAARCGEHALAPIKIELHTRVAERLPLQTVDVSDRVFPRDPQAGMNGYPSASALLAHLLLHAAGNMVGRKLRLIQLHDIALLAARMDQDEWAQLTGCCADPRASWWAVPPLELVARYYPAAIPGAVLAALRPHCPRSLRAVSQRESLSDVSYARLRFDAFPGLAWSTSVPAKLSYILARIRPSREQLAMRASCRTDEWAVGTAWTQMSHGRRMLRWLLKRPPRPPAMHAVYAVLEDRAIRAAPRPPRADESPDAARMPERRIDAG